MSSTARVFTSKIPKTILSLYSPAPVIAGESENEFFELVDAFAGEHGPTTQKQWSWIMSRVVAEWERARLLRYKSAIIAHNLRKKTQEKKLEDIQANTYMAAFRGMSASTAFFNPPDTKAAKQKLRKANARRVSVESVAMSSSHTTEMLQDMFFETLEIYERIDDRIKQNDAVVFALERNRALFWFDEIGLTKSNGPMIDARPARSRNVKNNTGS